MGKIQEEYERWKKEKLIEDPFDIQILDCFFFIHPNDEANLLEKFGAFVSVGMTKGCLSGQRAEVLITFMQSFSSPMLH